jgi:hypothetical protein
MTILSASILNGIEKSGSQGKRRKAFGKGGIKKRTRSTGSDWP